MTQTAGFLRLPTTSIGYGPALVALIVVAACVGPLVWPLDPWAMSGPPLLWPGSDAQFPLGTDALGRDVLAGLLQGTRVSLAVGLSAGAAALLVGLVLGAIAGFYRGHVDDALMRLTEALQTTPAFLLLIVLVAIYGSSLPVVVLSIVAVSWPPVARVARAEYLTLSGRDYVKAAQLLGLGDLRIIFQQILPNALPPVLVMSSILVANAILSEAALSFLGLGDPNVISLGAMIGTGRESLRTAWYLVTIPGLVIITIVLAVNLAGDGLNRVLDPRDRA